MPRSSASSRQPNRAREQDLPRENTHLPVPCRSWSAADRRFAKEHGPETMTSCLPAGWGANWPAGWEIGCAKPRRGSCRYVTSFALLSDLACTWSVDREGWRFGLLERKDPNGMSATFRVLPTLELRCRRAGCFQHHQRPCGSMINIIPSWRVCRPQNFCTRHCSMAVGAVALHRCTANRHRTWEAT